MNNTLLIRTLGRLFFIYQRKVGRVRNLEIDSLQTLQEVYEGFWRKKYRLILAFQHPSTVEPALWPALLAREFRKHLQKSGSRILPFAHLVYDHRIPFWAGDYLNWLLPAVGAVPIRRGMPDKAGLDRIRRLLLQGPWPLMMAPEGGRTWRQDRWAEIEDGLGLLALWTYHDLWKKDGKGEVRILPLRCFFHWPTWSRPLLLSTLKAWENSLGIRPSEKGHSRIPFLFRALAIRAGWGGGEGQDFDTYRISLANRLLAQAGGNPDGPFLKELRYREGILYLPYRKRLPDRVRVTANLLGAAELLWYIDYSWDQDFFSHLDMAWEVLETLKTFAELLGLNHLVPNYPNLLRDAELRTGQPIDLSQAPNIKDKAGTLAWIREKVQHDGR